MLLEATIRSARAVVPQRTDGGTLHGRVILPGMDARLLGLWV